MLPLTREPLFPPKMAPPRIVSENSCCSPMLWGPRDEMAQIKSSIMSCIDSFNDLSHVLVGVPRHFFAQACQFAYAGIEILGIRVGNRFVFQYCHNVYHNNNTDWGLSEDIARRFGQEHVKLILYMIESYRILESFEKSLANAESIEQSVNSRQKLSGELNMASYLNDETHISIRPPKTFFIKGIDAYDDDAIFREADNIIEKNNAINRRQKSELSRLSVIHGSISVFSILFLAVLCIPIFGVLNILTISISVIALSTAVLSYKIKQKADKIFQYAKISRINDYN